MSLSTTHIGFAIRDFMEGREIEGERASRADPYAEEKYEVFHIDCSDASNPMMFTSGGTFKIIILRVDEQPRFIPEPEPKKLPKTLPKTITGSLLWKPGKGNLDSETD